MSINLPSYVDDVLEYNEYNSFPNTGESGKIYVDTSTNLTYRWGGTTYVEISPSLALGTTSTTAYRGDLGAAAYAHAVTNKGSAFASGLYKITTNSEGHVTAATAAGKSDIGLGNVENKSSATIRSEITSTNISDALGFTPYSASNPEGYITSADVSDTKVNVSTRGTTKAYILGTTSSPTSTKTAREAVAETGVYFDTTAATLVATTFKGNLTGTASGNLTSNSSLAWSKVTGADDLNAIENLSGTTGLLRKTAANTWELDTTNYLSSFTESDPVFSASAASSITNNDITNWNGKTSNIGTVTSVRVQATSPIESSTSAAQSSTLNTTISLKDAYGDLKNPYGSKTARYVLAAPANAAGIPSFRALTNADVGLSNVLNYTQVTAIGQGDDGTLRVWTGDPSSTSTNDYEDIQITITAYEQSTVAKAAALDLSAAVGSTKQPVYFKADGIPYAINYTIETNVPSEAVFTDKNVTQTATTTNANYELLFSYTANNTTQTEGARKTSTLTYNPSTKALSTGGTINGYTLAAASEKAITDSSSASAIGTGTSLPTERDIYYGLPTINGVHTYTSSTNIYAPTTAGTDGYILKSNGSGAPTWIAQGDITSGNTDENMKWTASTSTNTYYPLVSTSTATTGTANTLNSINFYQYYNTTGGYRRLTLGNNTLYTSTGGAYGTIRLYGSAATYYGDLIPGTIGNTSGDGYLTANRTWTLPNATGTIALVSNIPTTISTATTGITATTTANKTTLGTTTSIYGVQSDTTTASKVTLGTAFSIYGVKSGTNSTTTASKASGSNSTAPSLTYTARSVGSASGWSAGSATVSNHELSFVLPTLSITSVACDDITSWSAGSASTWSFSDVTVPIRADSATSIPNVTAADDVTVPIKNTSTTSIPNVSVTSATVSITDPGHTHTLS